MQQSQGTITLNDSEARIIYDAFLSSTDLTPDDLYELDEKYPDLHTAMQKLEGVVNRNNRSATLTVSDIEALAKHSTSLDKFRRLRKR